MGAVLIEMLSGRPAFQGPSAIEVLHAVIHDDPLHAGGHQLESGLDSVARRALEKSPGSRYASAEDMAADLAACLPQRGTSSQPPVRVTRRLIVLPFRILRPDPESEFLAYSLPDAITVSLSGLDSLLVRSSFVAARFGDAVHDLRLVAAEADVDAIIMGTLLRAGAHLRIAVQLVEAPSGTLLWSHSTQVLMDDLFQVQDRVSAAVVEALSLPVSAQESRLFRRDVPANPDAYAAYLRANRLVESVAQWPAARELYEEAVTVDPAYAPAWARYARCLRLMGKYGEGADAEEYARQAETAFQRAFQLNPDLSLAHNLYTYVEVETNRARQAMGRLLARLQQRSNDPELYGGLVHACRYCGLLDASFAADRLAKRLDPGIRTSVTHTYFLNGDFDGAIASDLEDPPFVTLISQICQGRYDLARATFDAAQQRLKGHKHLVQVFDSLRAVVDRQGDAGRAAVAQALNHRAFRDPEGWFYWSLALVGVGDNEGAVSLLARSVDAGLHCPRALEINPVLAPLRPLPEFQAILERARAGRNECEREFVSAGGPRLLGVTAPETPRI
jgi:TolB-like protein/tetratricopeptide (TPR) repeat protein